MSEINCNNCAISDFKESLCKRCDKMKRIGSADDIEKLIIGCLPSAPPERWIPCSERLPENSGWHIVTKELDYDTTFVGLEWYDSTNGWKYDNSKCIAWIPLPESYKGEQE